MTNFFRGVILGAPGSGKGTISRKIVKTFDVVHVSSGDIFRQDARDKSEFAKSTEKYLTQGTLIPDDLVTIIMLKKIKELSARNLICDGYPRTLNQAKKFFANYPLNLVISLKVPNEEIIKRLAGRMIHVPSGRIYNVIYKPPKVPGKDDVTGEPLIQRPDDRPEAIMKRLDIYEKMEAPIMDFYKTKGVLEEFSGTSSDELWKPIENVLKKYMKSKS